MTLLVLLACLKTACFSPKITNAQEDVVFVIDPDSGEQTARRGTILDWNDSYLELQAISGRSSRIATADVDRIETIYLDEHQAGDASVRALDYASARDAYREAFVSETRLWVKRSLLANVIAISRLLDENESACRDFVRLTSVQNDHRFWSIVPIPWRAESPGGRLEALAIEWLASNDDLERLIGAAWLVNTSKRTDAAETLRELARRNRTQIGQLANAQTWRLESNPEQTLIDQWQDTLETFPPALQPGPRFVLARAIVGQRQYEQAAIQFMRIRILNPEVLDLNAMALFEAGRALDTAEKSEQAAIVNNELKAFFPNTRWARQLEMGN